MRDESERRAMWVKVCGIRDEASLRCAVAAGVDAVGFNFWPGSRRRVSVEAAAALRALLPASVEPVGLFVNQPADWIRDVAARVGIATIQLHGDEPPQFLAGLADLRVIRVYRAAASERPRLEQERDAWKALGWRPWACLFDAAVPGEFGGTGQTASWDLVSEWRSAQNETRTILAGGLTPENVAAAIRQVRPWGVDVASGVESAPGVKDPAKVQAFVAAARRG
jgi:phosphoribosylanthranilate isomerase